MLVHSCCYLNINIPLRLCSMSLIWSNFWMSSDNLTFSLWICSRAKLFRMNPHPLRRQTVKKRIFSFFHWALNKNLVCVLQYVYSSAQLWLTWTQRAQVAHLNKAFGAGQRLGGVWARPEAMSMPRSSAALHSNLHCCSLGSAASQLTQQVKGQSPH